MIDWPSYWIGVATPFGLWALWFVVRLGIIWWYATHSDYWELE